MEAYTLPVVRKFCKLLTSKVQQNGKERNTDWTSPIDIALLYSYLSFDIMGQVCFRHSFDMLEKEENRHILETLTDGAQCLNTVSKLLLLHRRLTDWWQVSHMQPLLQIGVHKLLFRRLLHGLEQYKTHSRALCDRVRVEKRKGPSAVLDHLLQARHTNSQRPLFTREELYSESSLLLVAGTDTTAACLAATTFYLLRNPRALARVQEDVRQTFQSVEDICSGPQLSSCHFLWACIQESLRMSPPVGGLMAREVSRGGIKIDGHFFSEGVEVGTPHYAIHHEERYYPDPFSYKPERWLVDEGLDINTAQSAFCAFSVGSRGCVGRTMAFQELMVVLGRVMWEFDMKLCDANPLQLETRIAKGLRGRAEEFQLYDTFASKCQSLSIQFKPRESVHA